MRRILEVAVVVGFAGAVASASAASAASAAPATPYHDPAAVGSIGLCDRSGHPVTHGKVDTAPFVWRAVSTVAAPAGYGVDGRTATLFAYQPRQGVEAGEWSGEQLTSATRYANASRPTAVATREDEPLQSFLTAFHPQWDGLVQLRMYLGAPDQPIHSQTYPALNLRVTGTTWHVVGASTVSCNSGQAISLESIVLHPHPHAPKHRAVRHPAPVASPARDSASTPAALSASTDTAGSGHGPLIVLASLAGALFLGVGFATRRRLVTRAGATAPRTLPTTKGRRP